MAMRILTIADFFYPETVGGSAIMAYEIMKELSARGHEITVLTRQKEGLGPTGQIDRMKIYRYQVPSREAFFPVAVIRSARMAQRLLAGGDFDLINAHHASGGFSAQLTNLIGNSLPYVFFFQGPWHKEAKAKDGLAAGVVGQHGNSRSTFFEDLKYSFRKGADWFILRNCAALVTLSDYMRQEAMSIHPFLPQKHRKIPGGVDVERFRPAGDKAQLRRELSLPEDKFVLLTVRRLSARMGLENLVRAMAIIEKQRDDVVLVIGGRGELWGRLKQLVADLGLKNTFLPGYISYDKELPRYYQASDLFIMPSVTLEGFGLSTIEAMACGVPVLGTPTGGTPEILREVLPDFVLSGVAPEDIARGVLQKLPRLRDPALQARVCAFAQRHSWKRIADSVEALFQELVGRRSTALRA
jgi:glycosyltransferase involved in cell wall biosynthesis